MSTPKPMFEVDVKGLRKLIAARGKEFLLFELFQNAADEAVTRIDITLRHMADRRGRCYLKVEDDSPEGFKDISHAYTLFAESKKKTDATKRGRFNLGEKLVLALCEEAVIQSTTGLVEFYNGERKEFPRRKRVAGTVFEATVHMNKDEFEQASEAMQRLIIPRGITVTFNGQEMGAWDDGLISSFDATLPTVLADEEGTLRPTRRKTTVMLYAKAPSDTAYIYEMGIPVVECDLPCHVNVMQKVPLNTDRDNVTPAYKKELSANVLNAYADLLTEEDASASWINEAIEHDAIDAEAVEKVMGQRFGEKRVIYDPSDPEGTKLAMSQGYTVIPGRAFSKIAWQNIRSSGAALPAGQVTPSPKPYSDDPNAPVRKEYTGPLTDGMKAIISLTERLGEHLLGRKVRVTLINDFKVHAAATYAYQGYSIEFNVARLGKAWFEQEPTAEPVLDLIIHEFGHQYSDDHLSSNYHKALTKLGAKLARLALDNPGVFATSASGYATR